MICLKKLLYEQRKAKIMKYKVGDKVRIIDKWVDGCNQNREGRMDKWLGKVMTIRSIYDNRAYQMEEDRTEFLGDGWLWNDKCIAGLADNYKIVITINGKETLARLYDGAKVIKTAVAKCSPDDTFDFQIGAKLAFERLTAEEKKPMPFCEKPKYYNGKIICVKSDYSFWTAGKVYEVKDGVIVADDDGDSRNLAFKSFEDISAWAQYQFRKLKFIPLVK